MKQVILSINNVDYSIKFGFGATKLLAKQWKLKTLGEVGGYLAKSFVFKKDAEPTIKQLSVLGDFALAGILNVTPEAKIDSDDVVDALMNDMNSIAAIIELYGESLPAAPPIPKKK